MNQDFDHEETPDADLDDLTSEWVDEHGYDRIPGQWPTGGWL